MAVLYGIAVSSLSASGARLPAGTPIASACPPSWPKPRGPWQPRGRCHRSGQAALGALALDLDRDRATALAGSTSFPPCARWLNIALRAQPRLRACRRLPGGVHPVPLEPGLNLGHRDYFEHHKTSPSLEPHIGNPAFGPVIRTGSSPSRGASTAPTAPLPASCCDGEHRSFREVLRWLCTGRGAHPAADRHGWTGVAAPAREASSSVVSLAQTKFFRERLVVEPFGTAEYTSPFDGERRSAATSGAPPRDHLDVGVATSTLFADWVRQVAMRWAFALMAVMGAVFLGIRWQRQSWMRERSEAETAARVAEFRVIRQCLVGPHREAR